MGIGDRRDVVVRLPTVGGRASGRVGHGHEPVAGVPRVGSRAPVRVGLRDHPSGAVVGEGRGAAEGVGAAGQVARRVVAVGRRGPGGLHGGDEVSCGVVALADRGAVGLVDRDEPAGAVVVVRPGALGALRAAPVGLGGDVSGSGVGVARDAAPWRRLRCEVPGRVVLVAGLCAVLVDGRRDVVLIVEGERGCGSVRMRDVRDPVAGVEGEDALTAEVVGVGGLAGGRVVECALVALRVPLLGDASRAVVFVLQVHRTGRIGRREQLVGCVVRERFRATVGQSDRREVACGVVGQRPTVPAGAGERGHPPERVRRHLDGLPCRVGDRRERDELVHLRVGRAVAERGGVAVRVPMPDELADPVDVPGRERPGLAGDGLEGEVAATGLDQCLVQPGLPREPAVPVGGEHVARPVPADDQHAPVAEPLGACAQPERPAGAHPGQTAILRVVGQRDVGRLTAPARECEQLLVLHEVAGRERHRVTAVGQVVLVAQVPPALQLRLRRRRRPASRHRIGAVEALRLQVEAEPGQYAVGDVSHSAVDHGPVVVVVQEQRLQVCEGVRETRELVAGEGAVVAETLRRPARVRGQNADESPGDRVVQRAAAGIDLRTAVRRVAPRRPVVRVERDAECDIGVVRSRDPGPHRPRHHRVGGVAGEEHRRPAVVGQQSLDARREVHVERQLGHGRRGCGGVPLVVVGVEHDDRARRNRERDADDHELRQMGRLRPHHARVGVEVRREGRPRLARVLARVDPQRRRIETVGLHQRHVGLEGQCDTRDHIGDDRPCVAASAGVDRLRGEPGDVRPVAVGRRDLHGVGDDRPVSRHLRSCCAKRRRRSGTDRHAQFGVDPVARERRLDSQVARRHGRRLPGRDRSLRLRSRRLGLRTHPSILCRRGRAHLRQRRLGDAARLLSRRCLRGGHRPGEGQPDDRHGRDESPRRRPATPDRRAHQSAALDSSAARNRPRLRESMTPVSTSAMLSAIRRPIASCCPVDARSALGFTHAASSTASETPSAS